MERAWLSSFVFVGQRGVQIHVHLTDQRLHPLDKTAAERLQAFGVGGDVVRQEAQEPTQYRIIGFGVTGVVDDN